MDVSDAQGIHFTGPLSECLKMYLNLYLKSGKTKDRFQLETQPIYRDAQDHVTCRFKMELDDNTGFKIREMKVQDGLSGQGRIYRIANKHQIPGAASLAGLFPRPKPWEEFWKGKRRFRP